MNPDGSSNDPWSYSSLMDATNTFGTDDQEADCLFDSDEDLEHINQSNEAR